ncbi:mitochondrial hypoxia responsive domain containing protein [Grosmannia clavigera kw1407]|uniref:Mitochondrial hypoxia responsive domain containing protein n=1 Tax=Grosmannia clavigera (strain kw1407 / UAMH 11150) TaxID=655863 RepID=F0XAD3_GROCL|nr:mitochondrial hypoxia responsive domain containing protein [Grosmannia clavigera kw1407]EFX05771.1 mitochondrial hypoxia responsive domain containing protein [Grosmannia clavigera kw1407]
MPLSDQSTPSSFDENEDFYNGNGLSKITRKLKQEPLIPLGCLLTVAAFTNAYRAMRRGDHNQVQRMFRARIIAQGFTVAAMVAGGIYFGAERHKERELWKVQQSQKEEEKRQRWIGELEARDAEEKLLQERLARKRSRKAGGDASEEVSTTEAPPSPILAAAAAVADTPEKLKANDKSALGTLGSLFSKNPTVAAKVDEADKK